MKIKKEEKVKIIIFLICLIKVVQKKTQNRKQKLKDLINNYK
jgi:hypothetical protein